MDPIALLYDADAYLEPPPGRRPSAGGASGLMGRQVAGREFLDAYLAHGDWSSLVALVRRRSAADPLLDTCRDHPSSRSKARRLRIVEEGEFLERFGLDVEPPARLIHAPCPADPRYAWARQAAGSDAFSLCGVTHTTCSLAAMSHLAALVTAPFEPYDALICTSRAVESTVRAVTSAVADDLKSRYGGSPRLRPHLEVIPLGVDVDRFRPPTAIERASSRAAFGIAEEEIVVLFVGRLSHHAKAQPFPLFRAASVAARSTGLPIRLLMAGWAANPAVLAAFEEAAIALAVGVRVDILDGTDPSVRSSVWHAADVFASPSDSIQETFGLSVIEAMSSGLPVVASDWDGYRDLVVDGVTGFLVRTSMIPATPADATARLLLGAIDYDSFLAESGQATIVDPLGMASALATLASDPSLRRRFGAEGRARAVEGFAWPKIIKAYENLWDRQEEERLSIASARDSADFRGPACYPPLDRSFAAYPTHWIGDDDLFFAPPTALKELDLFLALPLTHHVADGRCSDPATLRSVLDFAAESRSLADLLAEFRSMGIDPRIGRATIAWMRKYGLLEPSSPGGSPTL